METQNIEYKESWRDECLKWICGFANAQGGTLYIGKNDKGEVIGVADAKRLLEDIPNKVKNTMGIIVDVDLMTEEGKSYIRIETEPCGFPLNYKGDYSFFSPVSFAKSQYCQRIFPRRFHRGLGPRH